MGRYTTAPKHETVDTAPSGNAGYRQLSTAFLVHSPLVSWKAIARIWGRRDV